MCLILKTFILSHKFTYYITGFKHLIFEEDTHYSSEILIYNNKRQILNNNATFQQECEITCLLHLRLTKLASTIRLWHFALSNVFLFFLVSEIINIIWNILSVPFYLELEILIRLPDGKIHFIKIQNPYDIKMFSLSK